MYLSEYPPLYKFNENHEAYYFHGAWSWHGAASDEKQCKQNNHSKGRPLCIVAYIVSWSRNEGNNLAQTVFYSLPQAWISSGKLKAQRYKHGGHTDNCKEDTRLYIKQGFFEPLLSDKKVWAEVKGREYCEYQHHHSHIGGGEEGLVFGGYDKTAGTYTAECCDEGIIPVQRANNKKNKFSHGEGYIYQI